MTNDANTNDKNEQQRPVIDLTGSQSSNWMALSRVGRILGNDEDESEQTLNDLSEYIAEGDHLGTAPSPDASDVPYRVKRAIEKDFLLPEVADLVAGRIVAEYGDRMTADERERVRWLGDECVLALAKQYAPGEYEVPPHRQERDREIRERHPFEDVDLSTVDYPDLSDAEEREFFREKARRIRAEHKDRNT